MDSIILIGYSGHAYVAADILRASGLTIKGYCDAGEKEKNPFDIPFLGKESGLAQDTINTSRFFVGIGDNQIRKRVYDFMQSKGGQFVQAVHPKAVIASSVKMEPMVMVAAGVCINPLASIGKGVVCNTNSTIEHECVIGDFAHIAPGAVLCGNVEVGALSFIGASAVVKQGVSIGKNCMIGAGAVILKDVPNGAIIIGNPGREK